LPGINSGIGDRNYLYPAEIKQGQNTVKQRIIEMNQNKNISKQTKTMENRQECPRRRLRAGRMPAQEAAGRKEDGG